jgi:hypothetical protein
MRRLDGRPGAFDLSTTVIWCRNCSRPLGTDGVPELILETCAWTARRWADQDVAGGPWWPARLCPVRDAQKRTMRNDVRATYDVETLKGSLRAPRLLVRPPNITDDTIALTWTPTCCGWSDGWHEGETRSTDQ